MKEKIRSFFKNNKVWSSIFVCFIMCVILLFIPTGYESALPQDGSMRIMAKVTSVDDHNMVSNGMVVSGEQSCTVELMQGKYKGGVYDAPNMLTGSLELDKVFSVNELALVLVAQDGENVTAVSMIDHYRVHWEIILLVLFFLFLILFAGPTGIRAILSFIVTILMIWKVLIPCCLNNYNPIVLGIVVTGILTTLIIALVYGFDKRCVAAVSGAIIGLIVTGILGIVATQLFKIHGAVMSYSEQLLYNGYKHLDLTKIFMASIFIGSSGAMMDLCVDITSAVYEVVQKRPDLNAKEAIKSGFNVGRAAMGTMTTTLLLAYSGGFIGLLMVFMAQGTPIINILNYKYVASELVHTIVGSFGLVAAAPLTAITSGILLTKKQS